MIAQFRSRCAHAARILFGGFVCLSMVGLFQQPSFGGLFTLVDENSSMTINTASPSNASSWVVDGNDQLAQQAFWYRLGNTSEQSVHSLPIVAESATDTNLDLSLDTLNVRYLGAGFRIDVRYSLDGGLGGSRASDMAEQISISNLSTGPLDFHFFQYNDFDLNATAAGDSAVFTNANAVQHFEGATRISETVVTPVPTHREIGIQPSTLSKLTDALPTTLNDSPAIGNIAGPGDLTWAFQWDFVLAPGRTFQISKDKHLAGVPEPAAAVLLMIGLGLISVAQRTR